MKELNVKSNPPVGLGQAGRAAQPANRALAPLTAGSDPERTLERIGLVDLADRLRPGRSCSGGT